MTVGFGETAKPIRGPALHLGKVVDTFYGSTVRVIGRGRADELVVAAGIHELEADTFLEGNNLAHDDYAYLFQELQDPAQFYVIGHKEFFKDSVRAHFNKSKVVKYGSPIIFPTPEPYPSRGELPPYYQQAFGEIET